MNIKMFFQALCIFLFFSSKMNSQDASSVLSITSNNFTQEVEQDELPVFVAITAQWCPRCQRLERQMTEITQEFKDLCRFGKIDVDLSNDFLQELLQGIFQKHFHIVLGFPALLVFFKGNFIKSFAAIYETQEDLTNQLLKVIQEIKCADKIQKEAFS